MTKRTRVLLSVLWILFVSGLEIIFGAAAIAMLQLPGTTSQHYAAATFITAFIFTVRLTLKFDHH